MSRSAKEWSSPQNALAYLNVADSLPPTISNTTSKSKKYPEIFRQGSEQHRQQFE
jgi:hypothetical protein